MRWASATASLLATATLLWQSVTPAQACSCGMSNEVGDWAAGANVVVIGRVERVFSNPYTHVVGNGPQTAEVPDHDVVVSVEQYLKGVGYAEIVVDDPQEGGGCGFQWEEFGSSRIVLFLDGDFSPFSTAICNGALDLDSEKGTSRLAELQLVTGPGTLPSPDVGTPTIPLALAAVALPLAFLLAASFIFPARASRP